MEAGTFDTLSARDKALLAMVREAGLSGLLNGSSTSCRGGAPNRG